ANTLIATDVAARGLDVAGVGFVLQLDVPRDVGTFVHRVGRTGRAGQTGQALAYLDARSVGVAPGLVSVLTEARQPVPSWLRGMAHQGEAKRRDEESVRWGPLKLCAAS
ncbi:P-loop containing nucleoside triphosphate hydrolase protein, partial [Pelagophyceae sp. CCMP2097]